MLKLYHTGFDEIRKPDLSRGRANADFGQGFYLSGDRDFSERWARFRTGQDTIINTYTLKTEGLHVKRFGRDDEWFRYIFRNRAGYRDTYTADVIIGPIANDTIYDTWGLITSGLLKDEQALRLLALGPAYEQTVIKTENALARLKWTGSEILDPGRIDDFREQVRKEEKEYQAAFAHLLEMMEGRKKESG